MRAAAVVPAAGLGFRFGRARKLFVRLAGKPLLAHALGALQKAPSIRWIQIAARPREFAAIRRLIRRYRITKALPLCAGGGCRSASVAQAVAALPEEAAWVLIHDGARPCVSVRLIERALQAAVRFKAVACGLPASVTVKAVKKSGEVFRTLERRQLAFIQTPQVFRHDIIVRSLSRARRRLKDFPDDAAVVEAAGFAVRVIPGEPLNIKVTTEEDLILATAILKCGWNRTNEPFNH